MDFIIGNEELDDLISEFGRSLVGKSLKRLELASDLETAKPQIRELIYEELRALKQKLVWLNKGKESVKLDFNKER
jgi:hypothetical protein